MFQKTNILYAVWVVLIVVAINFFHFILLEYNFKKDSTSYYKNTLQQINNEFLMVYEKNKKLAEFIFQDDINTEQVKSFISLNQRDLLNWYLAKKYKLYSSMYSIRQLHFHTKQSDSFLRMHKPSKYGDSLKKVRPSVVWVNKHLQPYDGFEEGKVFNGFRYVFPLFDKENKHLGSVEISFDGHSFIESYLENFDRKRINLLIKEQIVNEKVLQSEKANYAKSPVKGFLFDVNVVKKLEQKGKSIAVESKSEENFDQMAKYINQGKPFWLHFPNANEVVYAIPLKNNLTDQVVGSVHISTSDSYIKELESEKKLYFGLGVVISFIMGLFLFKEMIDKQRIKKLQTIAEQQRNKAQKASQYKSEFLANMSHEIRTPLNAILGFVDLLKERTTEPESQKYLQTIDNSSHNLLGVINDILDFSKLENGKLHIENIDFDLHKEFATIYQLFNAQVSEKNIDLIMEINSNVPPILVGDPLRIKQVITNLLSNAIKFTKEGKKIYLTISYTNETLHISVKDEGIGIAKEKLELIFEAFSQADNSTTREFGGTGLGLSISSELVSLMGGKLQVRSELGAGSEFYFSIPAPKGKLNISKESQPIYKSFEGKKILLVEDNKSNQLFMKVVLKKLHLEYDVANDGLEAVEMFGQKEYDLVLMDENMPNMSGIEATKQILSLEKEKEKLHTPIIALTANALKGDREKFLNAGMDEYLTKPVDRKKLQEILNRFLFQSTIKKGSK